MKVAQVIWILMMLISTYSVKADSDEVEEEGVQEDSGSSESSSGISSSQKAKLLELLKNEGKPGWLEMAKKLAKERAEKTRDQEMRTGNDKSKAKRLHHDINLPTQLISQVTSKVSQFTGPLATRVKTSVQNLDSKWTNLPEANRTAVIGVMTTINTNIANFGKAGENPIAAIQGVANIIGSIASNFGPHGQMISMGLGFVSAILGLFGKGPKPKPLNQVVREQIDDALDAFQDQSLTNKAQGLIRAFQGSKAYLDGAATTGRPLDASAVQITSSRVPMTQGADFMGELATVILTLLDENEVEQAAKCIKYCELYAQLTSIRDMILTQLISMSSDNPDVEHDLNGLIGYRDNFRLATKLLLEPLFTVNINSNILPYFDPENSPVTDCYSKALLDLGKFSSPVITDDMYCISTLDNFAFKDVVWETQNSKFLVGEKPYITLANPSNNNCYWKFVHHGNNMYSIVNKYHCRENDDHCGEMLSWDRVGDKLYVDIDPKDPILWEVRYHMKFGPMNLYSILCKRNCDNDRHKALRIQNRKEWDDSGLVGRPRSTTLKVGQLGGNTNQESWVWFLRKRRT